MKQPPVRTVHHVTMALGMALALATAACQSEPTVALTLDLSALAAAIPTAQRAGTKLDIRVSGDEQACLSYRLCDDQGNCSTVTPDGQARAVYYPRITQGKLHFTATLLNSAGYAVASGQLNTDVAVSPSRVSFATFGLTAPATDDTHCKLADCGLDSNPCTINAAMTPMSDGSYLCRYEPAPRGKVCRLAIGLCDAAETCDGQSQDCPADRVMTSSVICRPAAGECDIAETCNGQSKTCPTDQFKMDTATPCRPSRDPLCDKAEYCMGQQARCPTDEVGPSGTPCGIAPELPCQDATTCDGIAPTCPAGPKFQPRCDNLVRDGGFDAVYPVPLPIAAAGPAWTLSGDSMVTTSGVCGYFGTTGELRPPGNLLCGGQLGCQGGRSATTSQVLYIPPGTDPELYFDAAFAAAEIQVTTAVLTVSVFDTNGTNSVSARIVPADSSTTQCTTSPCMFKYKLATHLGTLAGKSVTLQFSATSSDPSPPSPQTSFCIDNVVVAY